MANLQIVIKNQKSLVFVCIISGNYLPAENITQTDGFFKFKQGYFQTTVNKIKNNSFGKNKTNYNT